MGKYSEKINQSSKMLFSTAPTVDFVICGTQKGGTSALDSYLREHPEICMAMRKEVHFFDNENYFSNGKPNYFNYHAAFNPAGNPAVLGEATPIYMYWKDSPKRIWEYNPGIKLIVILRNPIERAYSHWNMERLRQADELSFWDAIKTEKERCGEAFPEQHRIYSYVDRGFYLTQLRRIWTYFPRNQVLIVKNEELRKTPRAALNKVCGFLGVSGFGSVSARNVNSRLYQSKMGIKEKNYLKSIFDPEIRELERELKWNCSDWLE